MGTGDGLSVYKSAQAYQKRFFIGIDANRRPLEKISEKIYRRPAKGGLTNVLFVQAVVEELPADLDGVASEVQVEFPWGSLLRGVAGGDAAIMSSLRRICSPAARLNVTISIDPHRDGSEWERLGLPAFTIDYAETVVTSRYRNAGFRIVYAEEIRSLQLKSSWARRLHQSSSRKLFRIEAEAM
ncbi:MAG TPA: hypothetical protein VJS64_12790 [Pyrinomonadaceae bacterium]|nr:hypothetical protein [Pyrinomonadaceae bacterium]